MSETVLPETVFGPLPRSFIGRSFWTGFLDRFFDGFFGQIFHWTDFWDRFFIGRILATDFWDGFLGRIFGDGFLGRILGTDFWDRLLGRIFYWGEVFRAPGHSGTKARYRRGAGEKRVYATTTAGTPLFSVCRPTPKVAEQKKLRCIP